MTPEEIRIELFKRRKKLTLSNIADNIQPDPDHPNQKHGVSRQAVAAVIERKFVSRRIMKAVAAAIGKDVRYVFPEYFSSTQ